jgi:hypothetical protein
MRRGCADSMRSRCATRAFSCRRRPTIASVPAQEDPADRADSAERQCDQVGEPEADGDEHDHEQDQDREAAHAHQHAGVGRRRDQAHQPQKQHLAVARRLLPELLHRLAQLVRAPFGLCERRLHHLAQHRPFLRVAGRERLVEVLARGVRVVALGRACAQDRLGRRPVLGLALELLVGAVLELRDHRKAAHLVLHARLSLLRHGGASVSDGGGRVRLKPTRFRRRRHGRHSS